MKNEVLETLYKNAVYALTTTPQIMERKKVYLTLVPFRLAETFNALSKQEQLTLNKALNNYELDYGSFDEFAEQEISLEDKLPWDARDVRLSKVEVEALKKGKLLDGMKTLLIQESNVGADTYIKLILTKEFYYEGIDLISKLLAKVALEDFERELCRKMFLAGWFPYISYTDGKLIILRRHYFIYSAGNTILDVSKTKLLDEEYFKRLKQGIVIIQAPRE